MKNTMLKISALLLGLTAINGCSSDPPSLGGDDIGAVDPGTGTDPGVLTPPVDDPGNPGGPGASCNPGRDYLDLGGKSLVFNTEADGKLTPKRVVNIPGIDRDRVKPFSALTTEFPRVLGAAPGSLNGSASTFADSPVRWLDEPVASAISLYTTYRISFDGCLTAVNTDAKYATMPDATTAAAECATWARKYWSRAASPEDIAACVKVATDASTANEVQTSTAGTTTTPVTPKRRWAYTCASVLSAAGFVTY